MNAKNLAMMLLKDKLRIMWFLLVLKCTRLWSYNNSTIR